MDNSKPLDLDKVDPCVWRILVADKVYGPFTLGQLRVFILDGRINARSKIAEGDGGRILAAGECPQLAPAFAERLARARPRELANFVVVAQLEHGTQKIIDVLNELGSFAEAMPGIFLLRSDIRLAQIQSRVSEVLASTEKILIVDATNDRLGWLGLGFEANEHLRAIWNKAA